MNHNYSHEIDKTVHLKLCSQNSMFVAAALVDSCTLSRDGNFFQVHPSKLSDLAFYNELKSNHVIAKKSQINKKQTII